MPDQITKGVACIILTTLIASTAAAATKLIADGASVAQISLIQYLICLLLVVPGVRAGRLSLHIRHDDRLTMLARALSGLIGFYCYFLAIRHIPLVEATLLRNGAPLLVPLVTHLWLGTRMRWHSLTSLGLGFIGILLILNPAQTQPDSGHLLGLIAACALAVSIVSTSKLATTYKPLVILFYYYLVATLGILPVALADWQPIAREFWPYLLYIGASIHLAFVLYTTALRFASPAVIAPFTYFSVVFAGLLDWLLWQTAPTPLAIAGMALVTIAGAGTTYLSSRDATSTAMPK